MSDVRAQLISDLKAARAELVARGRAKGKLVRESGQVCARGAVACAVVDGFDAMYLARECDEDGIYVWARALGISSNLRWYQACDELARHLPNDFTLIESFNDSRSTTDQDVLNLFDKALADLGGAL